jgi:hypothetical protein
MQRTAISRRPCPLCARCSNDRSSAIEKLRKYLPKRGRAGWRAACNLPGRRTSGVMRRRVQCCQAFDAHQLAGIGGVFALRLCFGEDRLEGAARNAEEAAAAGERPVVVEGSLALRCWGCLSIMTTSPLGLKRRWIRTSGSLAAVTSWTTRLASALICDLQRGH